MNKKIRARSNLAHLNGARRKKERSSYDSTLHLRVILSRKLGKAKILDRKGKLVVPPFRIDSQQSIEDAIFTLRFKLSEFVTEQR